MQKKTNYLYLLSLQHGSPKYQTKLKINQSKKNFGVAAGVN